MATFVTRWSGSGAPRGDDYDARFRRLAAQGQNVHGEADLVDALLRAQGGTRVLDAGCGTGRVAIELAARGYDATGVDLDDAMLAAARANAPDVPWITADLAALDEVPELRGTRAGAGFDVVVLAGNVMIFVDPGTEGAVLRCMRAQLDDDGLLVAGFQVQVHRLPLEVYDAHADAAGFELVDRWATWDRAPYAGGDYAVSVHRAVSVPA